MPLLLPAVRGVRDALASSLLLVVPWSMFAAAALASQGAWQLAVWALSPGAAIGAVVLVTAGLALVPRGTEDEDEDDGDGGEPVPSRDPSPRGPHGVALDWDAFDEVRAGWRSREPVA